MKLTSIVLTLSFCHLKFMKNVPVLFFCLPKKGGLVNFLLECATVHILKCQDRVFTTTRCTFG